MNRHEDSKRGRGVVGREPSYSQAATVPYNNGPGPIMESAHLSATAELVIAGGLGVVILLAPNIIEFFQKKCQAIKTRAVILKNYIRQTDITQKLKILNRRRVNGSIVRVIASLLPSQLFNPTCRIYIPDWKNQLIGGAPGCERTGILLLGTTRREDFPSENEVGDGYIEAFEIGSDLGSVSEEDEMGSEEEEGSGTSSTPEGWTKEQQRRLTAQFQPTINASPDDNISFARCSTPKGSTQNLAFETEIAGNFGSTSKLFEDQTAEISELKKMVEGLMFQINTLNQSLMTNRHQATVIDLGNSQPQQQVQPDIVPTPAPPPPPMPAQKIASAPQGGPPPPPPPPPPMPPMSTIGSKLVIVKKGNQDKLIQQKPQVSLSDVLKELPNAKLRRVERSPGGTPIKPQLKLAKDSGPLDIGDQLANALKKRYECMHSPAFDTDTDKENANGSDDSFEDSPISSGPIPLPAKRSLFPRSPRRRSSGKHNEIRLPFGQHLLKKRGPMDKSVIEVTGSPLREQNNSVN